MCHADQTVATLPATGKHVGQKKQNEWQDEINDRS